MDAPFVLGVNYWPRRKAMYWWSDFDAEEVRQDFALIKELGLDVVRLFLLWDDFQPEPDSVSEESLGHLEKVSDMAADHGLGLDVTFFAGHMSGPNWCPRWLLGGPLPHHWAIRQVVSRGVVSDEGYRNPFHDPVALGAERLLLRSVVTRLGKHPAIWMWNLGNEPDLFAWPNSAAEGRAWVREMVGVIKEIDPNHPVTCGLHAASLHEDNGLRISEVFRETDVAVMHAYSTYTDWAREPLDPDFAPYCCAFTAALCDKPVLMEEFGACTAAPGEASFYMEWEALGKKRRQFMVSEAELAEYYRQVLPRLQESGATGAILWCFADYAGELWGRPPCDTAQHERFFGLVRPAGSLKPHAEVIREFAATKPLIQPIPDWAKIEISADEFIEHPSASVSEYYETYLAALEKK